MVAFSKIAVAALAGYATAHPGEKHDHQKIKREIAARDANARVGARALSSCGNAAHAQALKTRSIERRAEKVKSIRQRQGIESAPRKDKRALADLQSWEAINHNMSATADYNLFSTFEETFSADTSCILAPVVTDGPYYVAGNYFRSNVKESQFSDGIDVYLEVQYIDVNTCEPIPAVAIDIWNANATGVYSGAESEQGGLNTTFLRGVQLTDHDGVANFETIFPGHYDGRATHTHLLAHTNAAVLPNGTIGVFDAPVAHIGQLFWPEDLRAEVETTSPYSSNAQSITSNDDDMWSVLQADESYDPIPNWLYLGETIEDGLYAWIQIGINGSADYTDNDYYGIAAYVAEDGGHSTGYTVGGGDAGGNGTAPSGVPSGAAPTASAA